jgi:hypothetical protein
MEVINDRMAWLEMAASWLELLARATQGGAGGRRGGG